MYSQNQEEVYILDYFKGREGRLLDIGANDGKTFSNSLGLIQFGWEADLVEPSPKAFQKLLHLHGGNKNVKLWQYAISNVSGMHPFYESGTLINEGDTSLVSSLIPSELKRWPKILFTPCEVESITYRELFYMAGGNEWDFISIDAEGFDWEILNQIDLAKTQMVCVEHNGIETGKYVKYCEKFTMKLIYKSGENIIMAK